MNSALYRYWFIPARWRRSTPPKRLVVMLLLAGFVFWLSGVPFRVWRPAGAWSGLSGFQVLQFGMLFFTLVNIASALAGATLIAGERERGTWESLVLTPLGVRRIVRAKLLSRIALLSGLVALTLPFWLMWAYQVLEVNPDERHPFLKVDPAASGLLALRMSLFLTWLGVRIVGRVLPFATFGLLISAYSARLRRALLVTSALVIGLCVLLWVENGLLYVIAPNLPTNPIARILGWPLLLNDFLTYTPTGFVSQLWRADLLGDVLWLLVLPWFLFRLAVRRGSRADRVPDWFERRASSA